MADVPVQCEVRSWKVSKDYLGYYRMYTPLTGPVRGTLCVLHGIQSHGGWYHRSSTAWAAMGYKVLYLDRRGSGLNWFQRGDAPSYITLAEDVETILRQEVKPGEKVTLVGTSWGAKTASFVAARKKVLIEKLIFLCPGFQPAVKPSVAASYRIANAWMMNPSKHFPIPLNDPNLFTTQAQWIKFLEQDGLALHTATARLLIESVKMDRQVRTWLRQITIPTLLILAEADRIIDNQRTKKLLHETMGDRCEVVQYAQAHHTLEFEPQCEFIEEISRWVASDVI